MAEMVEYSHGTVKDRNGPYWEDFKQIPTLYPPPDGQVLIADAIDQSTASTHEGVHSIYHQIDLLHEYRALLIADVVTGKLDGQEAGGRAAGRN